MTDREERLRALHHVSVATLMERLIKAEDRVEALRAKATKPFALEAAGVNNWEGYGRALGESDG